MVSRVTDSRKTEAPASSRRAGRAGSKQGPGHVGPTGASFSASFPGGALDVGTSAAAAGALDSNVALEALDTLLTVQENSGAAADSGAPFPDHEAAIDWSENVLRRLGELRVRLLTGTLPLGRLQQLARLVEGYEGLMARDPHLASLLRDISLRARVELAKYHQMQPHPVRPGAVRPGADPGAEKTPTQAV